MKKIPRIAISRVALSCLALAFSGLVAGCGDVTTEATSTTPQTSTSAEYVVTPGNYIEYIIELSGGSMEFDVWVPEAGRNNDDWNRAAIVEVYENVYRGGQDGYGSLLPYKIKTCEARNCFEPRYNLTWDQWRHVKFEWDAVGISAEIDGTAVSANWRRPLTDPVKLVYGNRPGGPVLTGAKFKNVVVTGAERQ